MSSSSHQGSFEEGKEQEIIDLNTSGCNDLKNINNMKYDHGTNSRNDEEHTNNSNDVSGDDDVQSNDKVVWQVVT